MNIPEIYYVGVASGLVGFLLGLIAGFALACWAMEDLRRNIAQMFYTSPKR